MILSYSIHTREPTRAPSPRLLKGTDAPMAHLWVSHIFGQFWQLHFSVGQSLASTSSTAAVERLDLCDTLLGT